MEIIIPVWETEGESHLARSDVRSLEGATVALVDDGYDAPFAEELHRVLAEDYGADVHYFLKPHGSSGSPESLIAAAAQCQVAIVGIAL